MNKRTKKTNLICRGIKTYSSPTLADVIILFSVYILKGCGKSVSIRVKDENLKCLDCGYRILFKMRAKKVMQYEARWFSSSSFDIPYYFITIFCLYYRIYSHRDSFFPLLFPCLLNTFQIILHLLLLFFLIPLPLFSSLCSGKHFRRITIDLLRELFNLVRCEVNVPAFSCQ